MGESSNTPEVILPSAGRDVQQFSFKGDRLVIGGEFDPAQSNLHW